jgi:nitrogenase molybdenum-iron protein alpha chain
MSDLPVADYMPFDPNEFKEEALEAYTSKITKKRSRQIVVNKREPDEVVPEILANSRTIPGILTMRGCCYAGCKGVVLGPTRDILQIVHGAIGCSFYAWNTRRNKTRTASPDDQNFMPYMFSTDLQEDGIVFGGEKKLRAAAEEAYSIFHPRAIALFSTCPVGLIGDDVHKVARELEEAHPGLNAFAFSCEGYKGVSQSAGHHIANNKLMMKVIGISEKAKPGKFRFNILGEYNIGGDAFEMERLADKMGLTIQCTLSGNSCYDEMTAAQTADLNVVMCHRSINYVAEMMETKFGIPWFKVEFIGADATSRAFRKIAEYFEDEELKASVEKVIAEEMVEVEKARAEAYEICKGKTVALFVGGSRAHHYQNLFKELGMNVIAAGYEFAHRDDYEGRKVIPSILVDADSRNIEQIAVHPDETQFHPRKTPEEMEKLRKEGISFDDYKGMMNDMPANTLIIDDLNHHELEKLIERYHPDIIAAGIKEKYVVQKQGIPMKQLHSYDYSGPYAGYKGAVNFYKEISRLLTQTPFKLAKAPWQEHPELTGSFVYNDGGR